MIVDGKAIAEEVLRGVRNSITHLEVAPHLTVFACAPKLETQKFLAIKKKKAAAAGISVNAIEFPENITTEEVIQSVMHAAMQTDGIIIQLPFPAQVDVDEVLNTVPPSLDVDAIHYDGTRVDVLPPVVGAIRAIAERHDVLFATAKVVIIGEGRLVGKPAALWAQKMGAQVTVVNKDTKNIEEVLGGAHIIISGAGQPGLITPDKIQAGVLIFDAGTTEEGGVLKGDAHPDCADKAELITPVPGGIGPITIAVLLRNLVRLAGGQ